MRDPRESVSQPSSPSGTWWREWEWLALGLLVAAAYFTRLTFVPVCGEESRWANVAREMIASGDWIVPRQQGAIFPERPPLGSWAMGLVGLARHDVDLVAVRLPSACATLLLTWLIYAYARRWISRLGSFSAAAMYATTGQVLPLGRFGESEAVFTLLVAASLLVWHWGYLSGWPRSLAWTLGYSLAAFGALAKGLQAPIYFVAATGVYLLLRRDWRWLLAGGHLVGLTCFAAIVGAWLVPFAAYDWDAIHEVWFGLAGDRLTTDGLLRHVLNFPFETFGCLLPWSPLLLALLKPTVARALWKNRPQAKFLLVALAVTYPSVWLAAGARTRYFMPLYPCLTLLMGLVVEHCTATAASLNHRRVWRLFLRGAAMATAAGAAVVVLANWLPLGRLHVAGQPWPLLALWAIGAMFSAGVMVWASLDERSWRPQAGLIAVAGFVALTYVGIVLNLRVGGGNDLMPAVTQVKQQLPDPDKLVSLGRVYHRFSYCYAAPIRQVPWPENASQAPPQMSYFCFDKHGNDTPEVRSTGDGRVNSPPTSGTLPFEWEKIAEIPCDPAKRDNNWRSVVIGRVRQGARIAAPPANQPVHR
jgi:4-amino-4-deoxy-L-arabinose transferase-like glycosyltransferase